MKRTKIILTACIFLAAIVGILLYNKSQSEAKSKSDVLTSVPVTVATTVKQKLTNAQTLAGTIVANSDVAILAETQGKVVHVMAEVGQYVSAGSTIIQIDDELKKASLASAEVNYEKTKKDLKRYESLMKENAATDQQLETARLACKSAEAQYIFARRQYRDTKITSPIAGVVSARYVDVGTMVLDKMVVANVVDISKLKVKLNVAEHDVFRLKVGDVVEISTDVYPGIQYEGTIRTIGSKADDAHTYPIEIRLSNSKEHPLKAGMFGRVKFASAANTETVTIPRTALAGSLRKPQVFVVDGAIARLRNIVVGREIGTDLAVLAGLREGETIVVIGQNNLKDSTAVNIVK